MFSNSNSCQVKKYMNEPITTSEILFLLSLIGVVRVYVNIFLGHSFTFVPQVIHSLRRIQVWKIRNTLYLLVLFLATNGDRDFPHNSLMAQCQCFTF